MVEKRVELHPKSHPDIPSGVFTVSSTLPPQNATRSVVFHCIVYISRHSKQDSHKVKRPFPTFNDKK